MLKEAVGEAAGGCSRIENSTSRYVDRERVERSCQLLTSTRYETSRRSIDHHRIGWIDQTRGFVGQRAVHEDTSEFDELLGLASTGDESATYQIEIEATTA